MIREATLKTNHLIEKESPFYTTDADINTAKVEDYLYGKIVHSRQVITSSFVSENGGTREHIECAYILTVETSKGFFDIKSHIDGKHHQDCVFFFKNQEIVSILDDKKAIIEHYKKNYDNLSHHSTPKLWFPSFYSTAFFTCIFIFLLLISIFEPITFPLACCLGFSFFMGALSMLTHINCRNKIKKHIENVVKKLFNK